MGWVKGYAASELIQQAIEREVQRRSSDIDPIALLQQEMVNAAVRQSLRVDDATTPHDFSSDASKLVDVVVSQASSTQSLLPDDQKRILNLGKQAALDAKERACEAGESGELSWQIDRLLRHFCAKL